MCTAATAKRRRRQLRKDPRYNKKRKGASVESLMAIRSKGKKK